MKRRLATVATLALLATGVSAQELKLHSKTAEVDYDRSVDFTRFKTFAWTPFQDPVPNPANHVRLTQAIERELEAKGLAKSEGREGDILVHYVVRLDEKVRGTAYEGGAAWQPSNQRLMVRFDKQKIGTLAVELWDGKAKDIVWSAKVSDVLGRPDEMPRLIDEAVKNVLAPYPPQPAVPEGGPDAPKP